MPQLTKGMYERKGGQPPESRLFDLTEGQYGSTGGNCRTNPKVKAPGITYIAAHARCIIGKNQLYLIDTFGQEKKKTVEWCGLRFRSLKSDAVKPLLKT